MQALPIRAGGVGFNRGALLGAFGARSASRNLRPLHRRRRRCVLSLRPGDLHSRDHDRDDADDLRFGRQRVPPPDGGVSLAGRGRRLEARRPPRGARPVLDDSGFPRRGPDHSGAESLLVASDGADLWVPAGSSTVLRVRGSDGRLLETWTGAANPSGVVVGAGHVIVAGYFNPGRLYRIEPRLAAGAVTTVATNLGANPDQIAYDGLRIWTADGLGAVSIVTPSGIAPLDGDDGHFRLHGARWDSLRRDEHLGDRLQRGQAPQARIRRRDPADRDTGNGAFLSRLRRNEHLGAHRRQQHGRGRARLERLRPRDADRQRNDGRPGPRPSTARGSSSRNGTPATSSRSGKRRT